MPPIGGFDTVVVFTCFQDVVNEKFGLFIVAGPTRMEGIKAPAFVWAFGTVPTQVYVDLVIRGMIGQFRFAMDNKLPAIHPIRGLIPKEPGIGFTKEARNTLLNDIQGKVFIDHPNGVGTGFDFGRHGLLLMPCPVPGIKCGTYQSI
jgi:hypothetical protein